jgi:hypothetical protein
MARIEESIDIVSPIEKVFTYTMDASSWNQWHSIILESEQTSQGPVGIGTTFRGTSRMMGRNMEWTAKATEFEPQRKFGKEITSGSLLIRQHNTYVPTKEGVKVTIVYDMSFGGFLKLMSPMIVSSMRTDLKKSLGNLKRILEA